MTELVADMERNTELLKAEINTRLQYALGDITPDEDRMTRAVESIADLIVEMTSKLLSKSEVARVVEGIRVERTENYQWGEKVEGFVKEVVKKIKTDLKSKLGLKILGEGEISCGCLPFDPCEKHSKEGNKS